MLRIDRYIMQRFLLGIVPALLLLLALFNLVALAEALEDVGQGDFTLADALMVVFLTTPKRIVDLLPVTSLLGGLLGLGAMANYRELIAIRTNGMSKRRIALTVSMAACLLGVLITLLQFFVVPGFEREAAQLRGKSQQGTSSDPGHSGAFWTRNGPWFIRVDAVRFGRSLSGIEVYSIDQQGLLMRLVQADRADYAGSDNWLLSGVLQSNLEDTSVTEMRNDTLVWKDLLSAEQASVMVLPLEALAPNDLVNTIANLKRNNLATHEYEIVFWQQVSLLPGLFAMALLSLPFLLGSVRNVSASQRAIYGGLIGIGFYLAQQLSGHLPGIMGMNPALLILSPPFVLLAIAIAMIRHRNL